MTTDSTPSDPISALLPPHMAYDMTGPNTVHHDIYPSISPASTPSLHQPGKVVLITGAGRGCGRAIALQYALAGVSAIILVARTLPQLDAVASEIKAISPSIRVRKYSVDVKNQGDVAKCAEQVTAAEGRLDVLVNNAGVSDPWTPIDQSDPSKWWNTLEVNLKGPYLFLRAFVPLLVQTAETQKRGVDVVNVSSIGALAAGVPGSSAYIISKTALNRLSEFVEVEYGAKGVNCVSIHPGGVMTELGKQEEEALRPFLVDTADLSGGFVVWLTAAHRTWLAGRYVSAHWDVDVLEKMKDDIVAGDKLKLKIAL